MLTEVGSITSARKRFLILKVGAFGDICFGLPLVSALNKYYPGSSVEWLVDRTYEEFLSGYEGISKILPIDSKYLYNDSYTQRILGVLKIRQMTKKYDAVFILHRSSSYVALTAGRSNVFQIVREKSWVTQPFVNQVEIPILSTHESLAYKKVFEAWHGSSIPDSDWKTPSRRNTPSPSYSKILALHIGGGDNQKTNFNLKKWPHFRELIYAFLKQPQYSDFQIVLLGTPSDRQELGDLTPSARITDLTGKTKLSELPEFAADIDLFVGPDSGLLHLYDQADIPSLGLYGPTSDISWGLIGKRSETVRLNFACQPCYQDDGRFPSCPYNHRCMKELSANMVLQQIARRLPHQQPQITKLTPS